MHAAVADDADGEETVQGEYDAVHLKTANEGNDEPDGDRDAYLQHCQNVEVDQDEVEVAVQLVSLRVLFLSCQQLLIQDALNSERRVSCALLLQDGLSPRRQAKVLLLTVEVDLHLEQDEMHYVQQAESDGENCSRFMRRSCLCAQPYAISYAAILTLGFPGFNPQVENTLQTSWHLIQNLFY